MKLKNITWEKEYERKIRFWFDKEGEELQRCLVAQGYKIILFKHLLILFGSLFTAFELVKNIEKEVLMKK